MKAVILAGGRGTRLAPYTTFFPKPLMPLGDMPIIEVVIRQLHHSGFNDIIIAVGHLAELIKAFLGDGKKFGVKISYSKEEFPLGTAGPIKLLKNIKEPFLVINGDLLSTIEYSSFANFHKNQGVIATIGLFEKKVKIDLGVVHTNKKNQVTDYVEKPTKKYWVSMGLYMFEPKALSYIPSAQKFDLPDLIKKMTKAGENILAYRFRGRWFDIGRREDYEEASNEFIKQRELYLPQKRKPR